MKEEKQTGMVISGSPYREAGMVQVERKLSKEETKTLIDIMKKESYLPFPFDSMEDFSDGIGFGISNSLSILSALNKLGYTDKGSQIYTQASGTTFYRIKAASNRLSIISGDHYGNITEIIGNFGKFDEFCDYAHEKIGFLEAASIYPLLGLPILLRSRILQDLAMDLPKEFAGYKYGKEAVRRLELEYLVKFPELSEEEIMAEEAKERIKIERATAFDKYMRELRKKPKKERADAIFLEKWDLIESKSPQ
ncbi:MAG: hypothetical protein Q8L34_06275, partial [Candidatus Woesearchaeota archaeon]|nr:hypothetical protein [Candidatus Woesearchaeota archaeon]